MLGFICALGIEVEGIVKLMENKEETTVAKITYTKGEVGGKEVVCCECGIGKVNAAMSTQIMIDLYQPDVIINSGIAGSLSGDIRIGDIVISDDCVQHDMDGTEMGDPLGQVQFNDEKRTYFPADKETADKLYDACRTIDGISVFRGRIASGDVFISSRDRRQKVADHFGALACEMEGAAIGHVCYRCGVPFAILRAISDDLNENKGMDFMKFCALASEKTVHAVKAFIEKY